MCAVITKYSAMRAEKYSDAVTGLKKDILLLDMI
jgi:hypothetical protein